MTMLKKKITSVIIAALLLISVSGQAMAAFSDVSDNNPYKVEIDYAEAKGYVTGTGGGMFSPDATLTRAQLSVVWCRLLMLHDANPGFTDITALNNYYDTAAIVMNSLGIISVDREIAEKAGGYKNSSKGHSLELDDCIIAATAFIKKAVLATGNSRHYPMSDISKVNVKSE